MTQYKKNIVKLFTGNALSQIILILALPIITRVYTTSDFGAFSFFTALVGVLVIIASMKYETAIVLPKRLIDAKALVQLSIFCLIGFSVMVMIGLILYQSLVESLFIEKKILYFVPLAVFIAGLYNIMFFFHSREQMYSFLSKTKILQSASISGLQITLGLQKLSSIGLIWGKIIGEGVAVGLLFTNYIKTYKMVFSSFMFKRMIVNAKRYDNFPKYYSGAGLINAFSQYLPVLMFGYLFSLEAVALYSLAIRILQAPITLIGGSVRQVFYQEATRIYNEKKSLAKIYRKTTFTLFLLFLLPCVIVVFLGPDLFSFAFGIQWRDSGLMSQILIFWVFSAFVNPPSTMLYQIFNKQSKLLSIEIVSLILRVFGIGTGYVLDDTVLLPLMLYALVGTLTNVYIMFDAYVGVKKYQRALK